MWSRRVLPSMLLIGATTLAGCGSLIGDPEPAPSTVPQGIGVYLNCGGPASPGPLRDYRYDIDGDGVSDRFVDMRCPNASGDQLEVFDGRSPHDRPQRLGGADAGPLIHRDKGVNLEQGCLMFSGRTILVGAGTPRRGQTGVRVAWIGDWDDEADEVIEREPDGTSTIPCPAARS